MIICIYTKEGSARNGEKQARIPHVPSVTAREQFVMSRQTIAVRIAGALSVEGLVLLLIHLIHVRLVEMRGNWLRGHAIV